VLQAPLLRLLLLELLPEAFAASDADHAGRSSLSSSSSSNRHAFRSAYAWYLLVLVFILTCGAFQSSVCLSFLDISSPATTQLSRLLLSQLRWLDCAWFDGDALAECLREALTLYGTLPALQFDLIAALPEMIDDANHAVCRCWMFNLI
jgi:hypothetical protein